MYVKNVDGKPIFATHLIECSYEEVKELPYQTEKEGIVSYSKQETSNIIKYLKEFHIDYTVKSLNNANTIAIDQSIKYQNKDEIIEHLQHGKKPKDMNKKELEKRVETLEKQVKVLMDKLSVRH